MPVSGKARPPRPSPGCWARARQPPPPDAQRGGSLPQPHLPEAKEDWLPALSSQSCHVSRHPAPAGWGTHGLGCSHPRGSLPRGSLPRGNYPRGSHPRGSHPHGRLPHGSPWCSSGQGVLQERAAPHLRPASYGQVQDLAVCALSYRKRGSLPFWGRGVLAELAPRSTLCCGLGPWFSHTRAPGAYMLVVENVWRPSLWPQESEWGCPCPRTTGQAHPAGVRAWLGLLGRELPPSTWSSVGAGWRVPRG